MLQINEETGTARSVARKVLNSNDSSTNATSLNATKPSHHHNNNNNESAINKNIVNKTTTSSSSRASSSTTETSKSQTIAKDYRLDYINKKPLVYSEFINSLFPVLYEVYSSSAGPSIKHKSLRSLLRLIFYSSKLPAINASDSDDQQASTNVNDSKANTLLYNLLHYLPISSHIASMLASNDTKIIVSALQLSEILMQNLPDIFSIYFQREGVIYQIDKLIESTTLMVQTAAENLLKNKNIAMLSSNLADKNKNSKNGQFSIFFSLFCICLFLNLIFPYY
jgi:E3 ubiquitin-protein ligase TRIP12